MAEEKNPPGSDFVRGVLAGAKDQVKTLVVDKLVVLGGVVVSGILGSLAVWLKGATDLERGMLFGSALTVLLFVLYVVSVGLWRHLRRRKEPKQEESLMRHVMRFPRKRAPTEEEIKEHARWVARMFLLGEQLSAKKASELRFFQDECVRLGIDIHSYPKDIQNAAAMDVLLGPREPES